MPGPIANVNTIVTGINLDIGRALNMERGAVLRFIVPDSNQFDGWRTVQLVLVGFNRSAGDEATKNDGSEVIFRIAAIPANTGIHETLQEKDLHVEILGEVYSVVEVPPLAFNEAQVYTITCKTRTLRDKFFDNKR